MRPWTLSHQTLAQANSLNSRAPRASYRLRSSPWNCGLGAARIGDAIFFDNLSYGHAVPEPSTLILVLTGLGALTVLGWRKSGNG
jgi:hypothetical protein